MKHREGYTLHLVNKQDGMIVDCAINFDHNQMGGIDLRILMTRRCPVIRNRHLIHRVEALF